jgi:uncharacterized membrane protein
VEPLRPAGWVIQALALAGLAGFLLGLAQFVLPKGTGIRRLLGSSFTGLMALVALSSFRIEETCPGRFRAIHLLSLSALFMLPRGIAGARRGRVAAHRRFMVQLFRGALVIAGAFPFFPGRLMHAVWFGG